MFWILLDKTVEELTLFVSINRCLGSWRTRRFVELQGEPQGVEAFPWEQNLTMVGDPQNYYGALKQNSSKEIKKTMQDLVVFV